MLELLAAVAFVWCALVVAVIPWWRRGRLRDAVARIEIRQLRDQVDRLEASQELLARALRAERGKRKRLEARIDESGPHHDSGGVRRRRSDSQRGRMGGAGSVPAVERGAGG